MIPHSRPTLGEEEKKACLEVLDSLQIAQGRKVAEFEQALAGLTRRRHAAAVSSGTAALGLSLCALGVAKGDEVIIPSFTCAALLHALAFAGAKPVLADIEPEDFNLSAEDVKRKIRRRTKAVIVPHLFGRAAEIREFLKLNIPIIEDGTQALGVVAYGKPVGSFGIMSVFSFYATKMITTGEGGMILTDSRALARRILDLRDYDKKENYRFRTNAKMTDLEAAIGIEQLKKLPRFIANRRDIARFYDEALNHSDIILPIADDIRDHVYFRYVIRICRKAKQRLRDLNRQGIDAKTPVFKPLHRYLGLEDKLFPETVRAMRETCSLPIFPSMKEESQETVCRILNEVMSNSMQSKALCGV
ncbi:MAG TPA: DegT/DnrJ/EryC1/StrS aminotransferase family protein [bacterium]|nr:DegT/DnrJ/EryC1/StrS aminotransferase family protein [bacterium]